MRSIDAVVVPVSKVVGASQRTAGVKYFVQVSRPSPGWTGGTEARELLSVASGPLMFFLSASLGPGTFSRPYCMF